MPDLSTANAGQAKAPLKPVTPLTAMVQQQPDQSGTSSAVESSASDDDAADSLASVFEKATQISTPWCTKKLVRLAVARPLLKMDVLWLKVVGDKSPSESHATVFIQAVAAARWAHQRALDAVNAKVSKIY